MTSSSPQMCMCLLKLMLMLSVSMGLSGCVTERTQGIENRALPINDQRNAVATSVIHLYSVFS